MSTNMIWALAGRRVDAAGGPPRFPLDRVPLVQQRIRELLLDHGVRGLVSSAACGTDLLGLQTAKELGLRRRIVLPFAAETFRRTSVTDRPGDWGPLFDELLADADRTGDLVVLAETSDGDEAYLRVNETILDETVALAGSTDAAAVVIVWDGQPRDPSDVTYQLAESARRRGLRVHEVLTR